MLSELGPGLVVSLADWALLPCAAAVATVTAIAGWARQHQHLLRTTKQLAANCSCSYFSCQRPQLAMHLEQTAAPTRQLPGRQAVPTSCIWPAAS